MLAAITCDDFVNHGRFGFPVDDMYMLAHEHVRYAGDPMAAIAAEDDEALEAGLQAIILELEPLPASSTRDQRSDRMHPSSASSRRDAPELPRGNLLTQLHRAQGRPAGSAAAGAAALIDGRNTPPPTRSMPTWRPKARSPFPGRPRRAA